MARLRGQRRPTRKRYAEIQSALAKAGYFQGRTNGVWSKTSVNALKAFQEANGLDPTGKIDALSLIKLNLGPKYDNQTASAGSGAVASK